MNNFISIDAINIVSVIKFGPLETEFSQIESPYFTPNAWKSMGICNFAILLKRVSSRFLLAYRLFFAFQNEVWPSLDQLNGGFVAPLPFIWPPSILSTQPNKSVYFLLGGDCNSYIIYTINPGAGSGVGQCAAIRFSRLGCCLALAGRNAERLFHTAELCCQQGGSADKVISYSAVIIFKC